MMIGKRESMELGNAILLHRLASDLKIRLRFSGKARNKICTDGNELRIRTIQIS